jgi:hypothetical protein
MASPHDYYSHNIYDIYKTSGTGRAAVASGPGWTGAGVLAALCWTFSGQGSAEDLPPALEVLFAGVLHPVDEEGGGAGQAQMKR